MGDAESIEQPHRSRVVLAVIAFTPAPDDPVGRGDDDVADALTAGDPLGDRGTGQTDPRPQLKDVDGAQHLAEDPDDTGGGVHARGGDLQQSGLAGPVGAEDHPAFAFLDLPGDVVEEAVMAAHHADAREGEHITHGHPP